MGKASVSRTIDIRARATLIQFVPEIDNVAEAKYGTPAWDAYVAIQLTMYDARLIVLLVIGLSSTAMGRLYGDVRSPVTYSSHRI